jgi:hypothetical protein
MAASDIRSHTRVPRNLVVDLVRTDGTQIKETVLSQNTSTGGVRVATEKIWRPGERVLLCSQERRVPAQARVVYCQRLESGKFALGLALSEAKDSLKIH